MGRLTDDILKWTIDINGKPAQKELGALEQSTNDLTDANKSMRVEMHKLEAQGKKDSQEYKNLQKSIRANNKTIRDNKTRMKDLRKEVGLTGLSMKQLSKRQKELRAMIRSTVPNTPQWKAYKNELKQVDARVAKLNKGMGKSKGLLNGVKKFLPALGLGAVAMGLKSIYQRATQTREVFSRYEAVLSNTLGSQKAMRKEFGMLQQFAAQTPFSLDGITGAYVKLVNQGFKPTKEEMVNLGDLASAMGKDFDQLAEAVIDAQVGENERLKEFGIRAQKNGDKIKYTFKGVTTEVDNNAAAIQNYILSLGNLEGVKGGMEKISKTIGGAISNMGDAMDTLWNSIGTRIEPIAVKFLGRFSDVVSRVAEGINSAGASTKKLATANVDLVNSNRANASYISGLLSTYEDLAGKQSLTTTETEKLSAVTLALRSELGDAVVSINKETGEYEVNTQAVKDNIQAKLDLAKSGEQTLLNEYKRLEQQKKQYKDLGEQYNKELKNIALQGGDVGIDFSKYTWSDIKEWKDLADESVRTGKTVLGFSVEQSKVIQNYIEAYKNAESAGRKFTSTSKDIEKLKDALAELGFTQEDINARLEMMADNQKKLADLSLEELKKANAAELGVTQEMIDEEIQRRLSGEKKKVDLKKLTLAELKALNAEEYDVTQAQINAEIKLREEANKNAAEDFKERLEKQKKEVENFTKTFATYLDEQYNLNLSDGERQVKAISDRYNTMYDDMEKAKKGEIALLKSSGNYAKMTEEEKQAAINEITSRYVKNRQLLETNELKEQQDAIAAITTETEEKKIQIKQQYGIDVSAELMAMELDALQANYDQQLLTEEEFQQAKKNIQDKYSGANEEEQQRVKSEQKDPETSSGGKFENIDKMMEQLNAEMNAEIAMVEASKLTIEQKEAEIDAIRQKYHNAQQSRLEEQVQHYQQMATQIGGALGQMIGDQEVTFKEFGKNMIGMALDVLHDQLKIMIAQATMQSMASAESVATWGTAGFAKSVILTGLLEAAYQAAKAGLSQWSEGKYPDITIPSSKSTTINQYADGKYPDVHVDGGASSEEHHSSEQQVSNTKVEGDRSETHHHETFNNIFNQYAAGKYPVRGADDGKTYMADLGRKGYTGIYTQPTIIPGTGLMSEKEPELIVSGPHLRNLQMNYPAIIQSIYATRPNVPQHAAGQYPEAKLPAQEQQVNKEILTALIAVRSQLQQTEETNQRLYARLKKPIRSNVVYSDITDMEDEVNNVEAMVRQ